MKFAALVLLLAVGSQAASLQSDAPQGPAESAREVLVRVMAPFDGTAHEQMKNAFIAKVIDAINMGQSASAAITDQTEGLRTKMEEIRKDLGDKPKQLEAVVYKHINDYRASLEPLVTYLKSKQSEIEALKTEVKSVVESIGEKVPTNWEETKTAVREVVTPVREAVAPYAIETKQAAETRVAEMMEYLKTVMDAQAGDSVVLNAEEIKAKLSAYVAAISQTLGNN